MVSIMDKSVYFSDLWHDMIYYYDPISEEIRSVHMLLFIDTNSYTIIEHLRAVSVYYCAKEVKIHLIYK